ncbi:MAG: hypothetical protein U1F56_12335 [Rubrivivax sp.]
MHKILFSLLLAAASALAAPPPAPAPSRDVPGKSPTAPPPSAVDNSPRCQTQAVNECRSRCETRRFEVPTIDEVNRKRAECKQDCIRGC